MNFDKEISTIVIASFNAYPCTEILYKCSKRGIPIEAVVFVGDAVNYKTRSITWEYTNFEAGLRIVDLEDLHVPCYFVKDINSANARSLLSKLKPDVILQGGVGILKSDIIEIPSIGILNSHPGKLPDYQGCMAVEWSIYNDDPVCSTCHFIDDGIDTGPIITVRELEIKSYMDYHSIRRKALSHRVDVLLDGLELVLAGFRRGDAFKQGEGTYYKPMKEGEMAKMLKMIENATYSHFKDKMGSIT